jgi:hypothetical protein
MKEMITTMELLNKCMEFLPPFVVVHEHMVLSNPAIISVTRKAGRILAFCIMTGYAAFDIPAGLFRMQPSARAASKGCEPRHIMRRRSERDLIDVSPGLMTLGAECLCFMTGSTLRSSGPRINCMVEAVVQIMNILQLELVRHITNRGSWYRITH